jgi:hypothetical protein
MIKLSQLLKESSEEKRPLSNEVKKHFLEIVSTYNKYQEMMDRKSDLATVAETLGGITEAARTLAIHEGDDWFDKHTIKRNMSELEKLGKEFDKCAVEATSLDQRLGGLYEDMGNILSRYYKMGDITEEQMKERLGMNESKSDCGCGCGGVTEGGCGGSKVTEALSVDPRKVYGGTGAKEGMVLTSQKGLMTILDLSKKNPSNVFLVSDDNYTNFGPFYVKNGKVAKYTVANPNYDLEKNKVRTLKVPSDVILKFKIVESADSVNKGRCNDK